MTFNQNGVATGMLAELPQFSWKGAYRLGSAESVVTDFDLATIATSFAAVSGGNLTGNGFSLSHHTFGLVFCGPDPGDGTCLSSPSLNLTNMMFSYLPNIDGSNYTQACDFSQSLPSNSSKAHPEWVTTIKNRALNTYMAAFANLPAIVSRRLKPTMQYGGSNNPAFEHTVYIDGSWVNIGEPCSATGATIDHRNSAVHYPAMDCGAQMVLASHPLITDTVAMQPLVTAIGIGIGNAAVHETGHQLMYGAPYNNFPLEYMDCGNSDYSACLESGVYEYYRSTDLTFGVPPSVH